MRALSALAATAVLAAIGFGGLALWMRSIESDVGRWHVDLAVSARTGEANDYLAASPDFTVATPDRVLPPAGKQPTAFLQAVDAIALSEPRTERLAGSPDEGRITYIQRSLVFAFPDYVTVQAGPEGRAIWSRSRFGKSDLGVNRARIERWLAELGL